MIKNDAWIRAMAAQGMISPFEPEMVRRVESDFCGMDDEGCDRPVLSYGTGSYGYDLRLSALDFRVFRRVPGLIVNPKRFTGETLEPAKLHSDRDGEFFILPGHTYALGVAMERLMIPSNITCIFIGKSTYARCGLIWNVTPGEAGWNGYLTLEVSNSSASDCRVYVNEGAVQTLFFEGEPCETSYQDRNGKYQNQQQEVTLAKV